MKRIVSLLLALSLMLGVCACAPSNNNTAQGDAPSGYTPNTEQDYNSTVSDWANGDVSDESFDNAGNSKTAPTPGVLLKPTSSFKDGRNFPASELADEEALKFFYEGTNYAYGISEVGMEYIAYKSEKGELLDAVQGAGKYMLSSSQGSLLVSTVSVENFTPIMKNGYDAVIVDYVESGAYASKSKIQTTYIFKENSISVSSSVNVNGSDVEISADNSYFYRVFANEAIESEQKINSQWVYPSNGDYPYQEFESLCYKDRLTKEVTMYSFIRGDDIATTYYMGYNLATLEASRMPLNIENSKGLYYFHELDIAFVDTVEENKVGSDYLGLFKSLNSDFCAGIAPIKPQEDNSTVFVGKEVDLNLNVTNLTDDDLLFSLRYDIRDYYGNIVDAGLFIDSTVFQYTNANRTVKVRAENYGIYYLNLYVISRNSSYIECYPFALIEDYEYKYNETSPFGLNSAWRKTDAEAHITAKLFGKVGSAAIRINANDVTLAKELHKLGITKMNGIIGAVNETEKGVNKYVDNVLKTVETLSPYIDSFEVGNEMNLQTISGAVSVFDVYPKFQKYTFTPTYNAMKQKYPNIRYIPTPFSACQQEWAEQLTIGFKEDRDGDGKKETKVAGIWDKIETISTHIYGTPWMPDQYSLYQPEYKVGVWSIEGALQRMEDTLNKFCDDPTEIDFYITEVGYATSPLDPTKICLRTQADYNTRSALLALAYGADRVQFYNAYDRTNYFSGFNNTDDEWNFGAFYEIDYYGTIKPKPWGVAFAVMTRQLESIKKNSSSIYSKYDEGWDTNGVRAIKCSTELQGNVVVAWSNNEVLSNGKKNAMGKTGDRMPCLPWNNNWSKTDKTVFDAADSTVKVVDVMGNTTEYKVKNGKVTIELTGSPVYIYGVK